MPSTGARRCDAFDRREAVKTMDMSVVSRQLERETRGALRGTVNGRIPRMLLIQVNCCSPSGFIESVPPPPWRRGHMLQKNRTGGFERGYVELPIYHARGLSFSALAFSTTASKGAEKSKSFMSGGLSLDQVFAETLCPEGCLSIRSLPKTPWLFGVLSALPVLGETKSSAEIGLPPLSPH